MKIRKPKAITLHDGSKITIKNSEWRGIANCKVFDSETTEIIRVTRGPSDLVRVYSMHATGGKIDAERNQIVLPGADVKAAVREAVAACGLGAEIADQALAAL